MGSIDRVVDAAKAFACGLYRNYPGALIPNPIDDVLRLGWDDLCGDDPEGLPPPPVPPFVGGQCAVLYGAYLDVEETNNNVFPPSVTIIRSETGGYYGVSGIGVAKDSTRTFVYVDTPNFGTPTGGPSRRRVVETSLNNELRVLSSELRRVDGQPDNCGNPPKSYPPASVPPGGFTSPPTTVNYNDGDNFTAIFNLSPPTTTDNGPPDICLSVDVKGVVFKVCFPPGAIPGVGGAGGDELKQLLEDLRNEVNLTQNQLNNLQNDFDKFTDPPPPEDDPDLTEKDSPDDDGGEEDDLPGLKWVLVRLTTLPVKAQFGTPSAQFAGWITFRVGSDYTDRIPISFENSVFQAPPGSNGYAITFTNKARGFSRAYTQNATS